MLRDNMDGSLTGNWTPRCAGHYAIHMSIDGYEAGKRVALDTFEPFVVVFLIWLHEGLFIFSINSMNV